MNMFMVTHVLGNKTKWVQIFQDKENDKDEDEDEDGGGGGVECTNLIEFQLKRLHLINRIVIYDNIQLKLHTHTLTLVVN